jgi:hypothetical protein
MSNRQRRSEWAKYFCIISTEFNFGNGVGSSALVQTQSRRCTPRVKAWAIQKPSRLHLHSPRCKQAPVSHLRTSYFCNVILFAMTGESMLPIYPVIRVLGNYGEKVL